MTPRSLVALVGPLVLLACGGVRQGSLELPEVDPPGARGSCSRERSEPGSLAATTDGAEVPDPFAGPAASGPTRAEGPEPAPRVGLDGGADSREAWEARRFRLQVQTGVSGGLSAAFVATSVVLFAIPVDCGGAEQCDGGAGRFLVATALIPAAAASLIPAIVYGVRLHRHERARPGRARVRLAPGGLTLRF